MSEIDDAADFVSTAGQATDSGDNSRKLSSVFEDSVKSDDRESAKPGRPSQYAIYGAGFTATTPTIETLKPGAYEITSDDRHVFVTPMEPPKGLLLELPEMRSEKVISIIENFWNSEKDYKEGNEFVVGGAIFKAGVLVYGPPGTGKTCTLKIVANKMIERGGTVFYASCHPVTVLRFMGDFGTIEPNRKCIVILEDIDSLIENYGESHYLDMLDSAKTADNTLFIATTNYPDRLDPRIYNRPGRFSHVVKIGWPSRAARKAYLEAILKNHRDVEEILASTDGFSIDHLSALVNAVYREKKDLKTEILRLRTLFKVPQSEEREMGIGGSFGGKSDEEL